MHYNFISYLLMVSHLGLKGILLIAFVYVATQAKAIEKDSIRHWGFTVSMMKSEIIALDKNRKKQSIITHPPRVILAPKDLT